MVFAQLHERVILLAEMQLEGGHLLRLLREKGMLCGQVLALPGEVPLVRNNLLLILLTLRAQRARLLLHGGQSLVLALHLGLEVTDVRPGLEQLALVLVLLFRQK